jgi:hypothetical protein
VVNECILYDTVLLYRMENKYRIKQKDVKIMIDKNNNSINLTQKINMWTCLLQVISSIF